MSSFDLTQSSKILRKHHIRYISSRSYFKIDQNSITRSNIFAVITILTVGHVIYRIKIYIYIKNDPRDVRTSGGMISYDDDVMLV